MLIKNDISLILRAKEIFEQANERPPKERLSFMRARCGDDSALFESCHSLFLHACEDEDFIGLMHQDHIEQCEPDLSGQIVGNYHLHKKIGCGGMAEVYVAKRIDGIHDSPVALKLIRAWENNNELVTRFQQERKILARLQHPYICQFLDGGISQDSRPYFVMQYVQGEHIHDYCKNNNLGLHERLRLFLNVCDAISHAHQHLIIHRDIKPGNILVTEKGEVRLLDFGIAKLLNQSDHDNHHTELGLPVTPRYASPEQILKRSLSTASDQYSLAVLLFELLSEAQPYEETTNNFELFKQICEAAPARVSKKSRLFKIGRDLDTILLKALAKEPAERYASVQQFSEDLERFLNKRAIRGRSPSAWYSFTRFSQRNWQILTAVSGLFVLLLGQQLQLIHERDIAYKKSREAEEVQDFLVHMFELSNPSRTQGQQISAKQLVDSGVTRIEQDSIGQPLVKAKLLLTFGIAYRDLGFYKEAYPLLREALDIQKREQGQLENRVASASALAKLYFYEGKYPDVATIIDETEKLLEANDSARIDLLTTRANMLWKIGEMHAAIKNSEEALLLLEQHPDFIYNNIATIYGNLGAAYTVLGRPEEALAWYDEGIAKTEALLGEKHFSTAMLHRNLGIANWRRGLPEEALKNLAQSENIYRMSVDKDHPDMAHIHLNNGAIYSSMGNFREAMPHLHRAEDITLLKLGDRHPLLAGIYANLAETYYREGRSLDVALHYADKSLEILRYLDNPNNISYARCYSTLGRIYLRQNQMELARHYMQKHYEFWLRTAGEDSPNTDRAKHLLAAL